MGGMAAFIPSRRDPAVNEIALAKVREDKTREAGDGFDGSWVAHPDLVPVCREAFDGVLGAQPNQLGRQRPEVGVTPADLLAIAKTAGGVTEAGLRNNISVALQYLAAWLGGTGAVAIECSSFDPHGRVNSSDNGKTGALVFNLMEDAATAEISRAQIWQWIRNDVILDDGPLVTKDVVERMIDEELVKISELAGTGFDAARYGQAVALFTEVALADSFAEFFTLPAYERMP
jgi:malate synthase